MPGAKIAEAISGADLEVFRDVDPATKRPTVMEALRRGWRRRCPRCGEGPLFRRRLETYERCSACGLVYQPDHGDTLMFMVITDRVPLLGGIAAVYFGFNSSNVPLMVGFLVAMIAPLLATIRQRQGIALALVYLTRVHLSDPSDEVHA